MPSILILATKPHIQEAISVLASPPALEIRATSDVDEASDMLLSPHRGDVDVVVVDLGVEDWQGFVRWMADGVSVRWVAISERDELALRIVAEQFGMSAFLVWPDRDRELKRVINSLVRRSQ